MVYLIISIVFSLLTGLVVYYKITARQDRMRDFVLDMEEDMQALLDRIDLIQADIDMVASEGPQPVSTRLPKAVEEPNGNLPELESDGLPLTGHTIIVGQSGSGKSNVAMSQIIRRLEDGQLMYCVDTKGEIGPMFRRHMHAVVNEEGAEALFDELIAEAAIRQELFAKVVEQQRKPCRDYGEYYKRTGNKLPVITVVVEELVALLDAIPDTKLIKLLVLGRSAGVFVLALAQILKAEILNTKGSINFNTKVFLGRYHKVACGILFGSLEQEYQTFLGSPGKGIIEESGKLSTRTFPRVHDFHLEGWI